MWILLDARRAEYLAEHIVELAIAAFYQTIVPTNGFNVGIGHTSKLKILAKNS